jgi:tetratricopeptide (TPR) repeat protein
MACLLHAGRLAELENLSSKNMGAGYWQALAYAHQGLFDKAVATLRRVLIQNPEHEQAKEALAVLLKQIAVRKASEGDWQTAADALKEMKAVQLPEGVRQSLFLDVDTYLVEALIFLLAGERWEVISLLEEALRQNPRNGVVAHSLGLASYHTTRMLQEQGRWREAEYFWQRAVAAWVMILNDDAFWEAWRQQARKRYQEEVVTQDIASLRKKIEEHFIIHEDREGWHEQLFQRELKAAVALKELGGFPLPGMANEKLVCGPLMIQVLGLHKEFGQFVSELQVQEEAPIQNVIEFLHILFGKELEHPAERLPDLEQKKRLMRYFSRLGITQALLDLSRPQEALEALSYAACERCREAAMSRQPSGLSQQKQLVVCSEACEDFDYYNPGYAMLPDKGVRFREDAIELAIEAHLSLAQSEITIIPMDIQAACNNWREAITLSKELGSEASEQTQRRIVEMTLGRVQVLERGGKLDEAISLLERAEGICDDRFDRDLVGRLAELLTDRGVKAGNEKPPRCEEAVRDLRRAVALNPYAARPRVNLCIALRMWAAQCYSEGREDEAIERLKEAVRQAKEGTTVIPNYPELQQQMGQAQSELSILYNSRGVHKAEGEDWEGALNDIEMALDLDPNNIVAEENLCRVYNAYGVSLANKGQFEQAIKVLERGLRHCPDDEQIKENLAQIKLIMNLLRRKQW